MRDSDSTGRLVPAESCVLEGHRHAMDSFSVPQLVDDLEDGGLVPDSESIPGKPSHQIMNLSPQS
jgi:hypothetical protein